MTKPAATESAVDRRAVGTSFGGNVRRDDVLSRGVQNLRGLILKERLVNEHVDLQDFIGSQTNRSRAIDPVRAFASFQRGPHVNQ